MEMTRQNTGSQVGALYSYFGPRDHGERVAVPLQVGPLTVAFRSAS